jgi:propionyl-CoA carboxylase beta chain
MAIPVDPDPRRALLDSMNQAAEQGGGEERVARQHEAGKLTARERIDLFLDAGSFV